MSKKLNSKILNQIESQKMKPQSYFWLKNALLILALITFSALAIFLLGSFFDDTLEILEFRKYGLGIFLIIPVILFEFMLISLLLGIIIFFLYRSTDWILVRHKLWLSLFLLIFIVAGSIAVAFTLDQEDLVKPAENLESAPYRSNRKKELFEELKKKDVFVGKVTFFDSESGFIIVTNRLEERKFKLDLRDRPRQDIKVGNEVMVRFKEIEGEFVAIEITIRPRSRGFLRPLPRRR